MNTKTDEDLVHEALTIIYQKYKHTELKKGILPWAYRILDYVMQSDYKTDLRRFNILNEESERVKEIYGDHSSIEERAFQLELLYELKKALKHLNNKEKEIFELKLKGFNGVEIQQMLDLRRNTMDVRVFRGLKKIKRILENRGVL